MPADCDVLVIYDPTVCAPVDAYELHEPFFSDLAKMVGLNVHPTLLTIEEEKGCDFIQTAGAIRFHLKSSAS